MPLYQLIPNAFEILSSAYQKMGELAVEATDPEIIGSPRQPEVENQLIEVSSMYYVAINLVTLNNAGDTIVGISADASVLNALLNNLKNAADLNTNNLFPTPFSVLNFNGNNGVGQNFPVGAPGSLLVSDGLSYVVFPKGPDGTVLTSTPTGLVWSSVVGNGIPSGGSIDQYLVKNSNTSYDVVWATLTLSKVTDVTASASEVNILDGALISTAELNTLVGINTSSTLAAQLAAKQSTTLTHGHFLVGDVTNIAASVPPTGDITFNDAGLFSISPGVIVDADIDSVAGIARSKLALGAANRLVINDGVGVLNDAAAIIADKILISNAVGIPIASTKDASILDFLDITAPLQAQLDGKLDATITTPAVGDLLKYNGVTWINFPVGSNGQILTSNGTDVLWGSATANGVPVGGLAQEYLRKIDGSNYNTEWHTLIMSDITDVSTTNTEINLLSGLTVGSAVLNLSAGLTDNIQVQLNSKLSGALSYHALYVGGPGNTAQQVAVGADGSIFTVIAGHPTWQMPPAPGNVTGAPPTTDNAIVRWNLTAGDSIQNSGVIIDDSNNIGGVATLFAENLAVFNQGSLRLCEIGSANYVGLRASAVMSTDYTITLPDVAPTTDTVLFYNGTDFIWASGGGTPTSRALDINGVSQDLTANRTWRTGLADTGVLTYAGISVASGSTVNIGAVTGVIVDNETTPGVPTYISVSYAGATGVTVPTVGTGIASYVLLNSSGVIVFQNTFPTAAQRRSMIYLSKIAHPIGTITTAGDEPDFIISPLAQFRDLFQAFNYVNNGVTPTANGVNLNINTSAGTITGNGINFVVDRTTPNTYSVAATNPTSFFRRTQTGLGSGLVTVIDPANYDVVGTITAVGGGTQSSTIQYVWYVPPLGYIVTYGQTVYSTLVNAVAAIGKESTYAVYPSLIKNAILIGAIALRRTTTNLSDTAFAQFFRADIFGQLLGAAGASSVSTMQQTYNNSGPIDPKILTSTANGGIVYQCGSASDTDTVLGIKNIAGTATLIVNGNGTITTGVWNGSRLTNAYTPQGNGLSVWGVTGGLTADQASIVGTTDQVLRVDGAGTSVGFGAIDLSKSATVGTSILGIANGGTGSSSGGWPLTGTGTLTGNVTMSGAFSVGIGATPTSKLTVTGLGLTTGGLFRLNDSSGTVRMIVLDNGDTTFYNTIATGRVQIKNQRFEIETTTTAGIRITPGTITTYGGTNLTITVPGAGDVLSVVGVTGLVLQSTQTNGGATTFLTVGATINNIGAAASLVNLTGGYTNWSATGTARLFNAANGITQTTGPVVLTFEIFSARPSVNITTGSVGSSVAGFVFNPTLTATNNTTIYSFISSAGMAGFATMTPTATIHAKGRGTTTGELFRLDDNTPTNRFLVLDDGTIKAPSLTNQESYSRAVVIHSDGTLGYSFLDGASVSLTISGSASIDLSTGKTFILTQSGNVTSFDFSNAVVGNTYTFIITRTTNATFTLATGKYRLPGGLALALTDPTANGVGTSIDILTCVCNVAGRLDLVITPDLQNN